MCGNFNTFKTQNDQASQKLDQSGKHLSHLKISNNIIDSFKHKNPNKNLYTHVLGY